jgi:hypothetical protein
MEELSKTQKFLYVDADNVCHDFVPTGDLEFFFVQSKSKCQAEINLKPAAGAKFKVKIYIFAENDSEVNCVCKLDIGNDINGVETDVQIRSWPFDRSKILARPEMFIANSNTVASHGNALGILKPAEQYYLATRGVKDYKQIVKQSLLEDAQLN